jgi:pre-rRNA-processing protein TSR4
LDVFFEPEAVAEIGDSRHVQELLQRYNAEQREQGDSEMAFTCAGAGDEEEGDGSAGGAGGGEDDAADEDDEEGGDTVAAEFRARLEREPTQCLRYGYGGVPLWPSAAQAKAGAQTLQAVPRCEACDAPRAFELQLVPGLLWHLGQALEEQVNADFSSVLVFSCNESCPRGSNEYAVALPPL